MFPIISFLKKINSKIYLPITTIEKQIEEPLDQNTFCILHDRSDILSLIMFCKLHSLTRGSNAIDATVVDRIDHQLRFNIIYIIQSVSINVRYQLITWGSETKPALSIQSVLPAFNWAEREIWDLYGLFFVKHPDLRRILTDYGFVGHPLRKNFPLTGFKEVQYEDSIKQVEYGYTELAQSYRLLIFSNPWRHE